MAAPDTSHLPPTPPLCPPLSPVLPSALTCQTCCAPATAPGLPLCLHLLPLPPLPPHPPSWLDSVWAVTYTPPLLPYLLPAVQPGPAGQGAVDRQLPAPHRGAPLGAMGLQPALLPAGAAARTQLPAGVWGWQGAGEWRDPPQPTRLGVQLYFLHGIRHCACCNGPQRTLAHRDDTHSNHLYTPFAFPASLHPSLASPPAPQILERAHATTTRLCALAAALAVAAAAWAVRALAAAAATGGAVVAA